MSNGRGFDIEVLEQINNMQKCIADIYKKIITINESIINLIDYTIEEEQIDLKVRYHRELFPNLPDINTIANGDYIDLYNAEEVTLKTGQYALLNLGVSIKLPENYSARLIVRSSTYKKYKIIQTNSYGVIDNTYCGDNDIWMLPVIAIEDTVIHANERVAQFTVERVHKNIILTTVDKLDGEDRGGFGSTGTK
jgi:dUTP pyrophosphatase